MTTLEMDFRRSKYAAKLAQTVSLSLIDPAGFDLSAVSVGYLEGETWDHHEALLEQSCFYMEMGTHASSLSCPEALACARWFT